MTTYNNTNYSRDKISNVSPSNGDTFVNCNLSQVNPNTAIFTGVENLTFTDCNLLNCVLPIGTTRNGGLSVQKDFCGNVNPDLAPLLSTPCEENCRHVVDTDEIQINGETIETIYYYEDTVL